MSSAEMAVTDIDQHDALQACLLFVARHLQCPTSAAAVRAGMIGHAERMTPALFIAAARRAGMAAAFGQRAIEAIPEALLPVVLLLNDNSAVVLLEFNAAGEAVIFDPAFGEQSIIRPLAELKAVYRGGLIGVRAAWRPEAGVATGAGADARGHWFWGALRNNGWTYSQILLAAALTNLLGLSTSLFIMVVYDRVLPNEAIESLLALALGVGIALGFDFIIKSLRGVFVESAGRKADMTMARRIFDHLLDMQVASKKGDTGAFANTMREFETLRDFFASASVVALVDLPFIFLFIWVIHLIGGPLYLVPLLAVPIVLLVGVAIQPFLSRISEESFEEGRAKQSVLVEAISGLETIKATGASAMVRERWESSIRQQGHTGRRARLLQQLALNVTTLTQQAAQVAIVIYGVFLIGDGVISMGAMIASVILTGRTLGPLAQLAQTMSRINQARTSYRAIDRFMGEPSERPAGRHFLSRPRLGGRIEFRAVSFSYPEAPAPTLKDVSFRIEPGERVAILGRVGSGKSTIARLLLGLYTPESGSVLVDDTDIRQIDPADLRHNIGTVLQEPWLFSGTLRQNIAVGGINPSDEEIFAAARSSGAHDFIANHPHGYDRRVAERGEGLSGGQRQLICIARAMVGRPPIFLLDEPTSAMDVQTEQALIKRLGATMAESTLLVITHRPSLLQWVDRVIVIDQGQVAADGPKQAVLRNLGATTGPAPKQGLKT